LVEAYQMSGRCVNVVLWNDEDLVGLELGRIGDRIRLHEGVDRDVEFGGDREERVARLHRIGAVLTVLRLLRCFGRRRAGRARGRWQAGRRCDDRHHRDSRAGEPGSGAGVRAFLRAASGDAERAKQQPGHQYDRLLGPFASVKHRVILSIDLLTDERFVASRASRERQEDRDNDTGAQQAERDDDQPEEERAEGQRVLFRFLANYVLSTCVIRRAC